MSKKQSNVIDIGRYVRVPRHVHRAGVSPRAQQVWEEVALNSSPEKPYAWIRQMSVAEELRISADTVGRGIKELCKAGLLVETGRYHQGRYKYYIVMWTATTLENLPQFPRTNSWEQPDRPPEIIRKQPTQKAPDLIRVLEDQKKSTYYTAPLPPRQPAARPQSGDLLLETHEQEWKEKFKFLDGHSGRPSVRDCVAEAMNHTARHKCDDLKIYLEGWLRNAALRFKQDYEREEGLHWSDPRLDPEVRAHKQAVEEQKRKEFEERARIRFEQEMAKKPEPTAEELRMRDVFLASVRREDEIRARRAENYRRAA